MLPKFFELNGPSGTYSHACTSRADQSFSSTYPKIADRARLAGTRGTPRGVEVQRKAPSSSSRSSFRVGANMGLGFAAAAAVVVAVDAAGGAGKIWP